MVLYFQMNLYVFDIDGVITNPTEKIANEELLSKLGDLVKNGHFIAFNTGRSFKWTHERVLSHLDRYIEPQDLSEKIFASCEMGNITCSFQDERWKEKVNESSRMPTSLIQEIKTLVQEKYFDSMFFDEKETMISVEVKDGFDEDEYLKQQKELLETINSLLLQPEYEKLSLKTGSNQIALDIQFDKTGKKLGAKRLVNWIKSKNLEVSTVLAFGDNLSDIEMAEELRHLYPVTFVFVNEPSKLTHPNGKFKVVYTKNKFEKGTLEFLNT